MRSTAMLALLWMFCPAAAAPPAYTTKRVAIDPPAELAEAVREQLLNQCDTVQQASGQTVASIWFRKAIPSRASEDQVRNGLTYREIPETSLIAAIQFPNSFIDFRKQEIPAGVYTLRLAYQPETGDHMGTAPHTEFGLLCPASKDLTIDTLEPKDLYKLSLDSTGGDHPGVILLYPQREKTDQTSITFRGDGIWTVNRSRPVQTDSGESKLGLSLTIAGFSKLR